MWFFLDASSVVAWQRGHNISSLMSKTENISIVYGKLPNNDDEISIYLLMCVYSVFTPWL